jgi:chromosome segregation ATPase
LNAKNEELHRIIASLHAQLSEVENRATYLQQELEVRKRDQHSIDSHNSELTSQLNESRKKLRDLHEIFGSVQNVTAELSKKYDDTNIEYHRVIADTKRYELQLYDMNNMLQDAHNTLQSTTAHKGTYSLTLPSTHSLT